MKKTKLLPVIFIAAALTACNSSNAPGDRGNYDEPESTPTPTVAEEPEATPAPAEVPEETPTPTEAEEETERSPFVLWQHAGYVDEAEGYTWQDEFIDKDFDGDGTKDRVYREWFEEEQTAKYTIEFGNGRELIVSGGWETGFPHVQAGDLTGNGEPEILFTLSYDTSTDPMSFGEMWVFEYDKDSNSYKEMSLPLVNGDEGNGARCLELEYGTPDKNVVGVKVKQNGFTADAELDEDYLEHYWKSDLTAKDYSEKRMVWSAEIKDAAIHCSVQPFYKYGDVIEFDLVYNGKAFDIKEMKYVPSK